LYLSLALLCYNMILKQDLFFTKTEEICPYYMTCEKEMEKQDAITAAQTQAEQADK